MARRRHHNLASGQLGNQDGRRQRKALFQFELQATQDTRLMAASKQANTRWMLLPTEGKKYKNNFDKIAIIRTHANTRVLQSILQAEKLLCDDYYILASQLLANLVRV